MSGFDDPILAGRPRARGTDRNPAGRFERLDRAAESDGWEPDPEADPAVLKTEVSDEAIRRIITRNASPDVPFDRSVNPYRGCEHGCIYCFARPSHGYLGLSAGLDFETRLIARPGAAAALRRELSRPAYRVAPIAIGTNTDPYQPIEAERRIMRGVLEVLQEYRHPVMIATKGTLVERDIDILSEMAGAGLAQVGITITTLNDDLSRRLEPRVPPPTRRLRAIARLARAGIPVRVMVSPVIPALTDHELEPILAAAQAAGARAASWIMLRLPYEVAPLFREWLERHYPDRAARVMGRVRETQGGRDYDAAFGRRMRGEGVHAQLIARRFDVAAARLGLNARLPTMDCDRFAPPGHQLSLF